MTEGVAVAWSCRKCGHTQPTWFMRCQACLAMETACKPGNHGHTNSSHMAMKSGTATIRPGIPGTHGTQAPSAFVSTQEANASVRSLADYRPDETPRVSTGSAEIDRVLGGGLVAGEVVLVGGDPGVGKSSILAQIQARMVAASDFGTGFYGSGEESYDQIARRAERLGVRSPRVHVLHTSDIDEVVSAAASSPRMLAVFDSAQVFRHAESRGATGSPSQVKACCERIVAYARASGTPCVIVCHITKDGDLAGPKTLEHLVDCVIQIELASDGIRRIVSAAKNRHGDTSEVGMLEMTTGGLVDAPHDDQAALLERAVGRPGSAVACVYTGARALCVEVQALCAYPRGESGGKLTCVGIDPKRATTLLAVLAEHAGIDALNTRDVFLSVAGGINLRDPSADAAIALAIASSFRKVALDSRTIAIGEVGLAGELRSAPGARQRMIEAVRAGFTRVIVAPGTAIPSPEDLGVTSGTDLVILRAAAIEDAIALAVPEIEVTPAQVYPAGDANASIPTS